MLLTTSTVALVPLLLMAAPPKIPVDIGDYYEVLAAKRVVDRAFERADGGWQYRHGGETADGDGAISGLAPLIVDAKNGYLLGTFDEGPLGGVKLELALFVARDGRKFVVTNYSGDGDMGRFLQVKAYQFTGATFRDATSEMGALASLLPHDFLDESYVGGQLKRDDQAFAAKQDDPNVKLTVDDFLSVVLRLPRVGTVIEASMTVDADPPPISAGPELLAQAGAIVKAHRKYQSIELTWSKDEAKFSIGKRK